MCTYISLHLGSHRDFEGWGLPCRVLLRKRAMGESHGLDYIRRADV